MRFRAALAVVTLASSAIAELLPASSTAAPPTLDKQACFKLAEDGQDLRTSGKLKGARAKFLECARATCPAVVKQDCTKWLTEVEADIPSIVVRATKGDVDVAITRVTIDGVEATGFIEGQSISLDPGARKIAVVPKGEAEMVQTVTIVAGERNRAITFKMAEPTTKVSPSKEEHGPEKKRDPAPEAQPGPSAWPFIVAGVGVVALGGFAAFALSGRSDVRKLEERGCEPRCADADVDAAKRKFLFADISLGVSIVSFAIATYGFVSTSKPKTTATVSLGPGFGFAGLAGSF